MKQNLIRLGVKQGDRLGIAVSGGADSMVLLHLACALKDALGIEVEAYHMEHGIREGESQGDMRFVQTACERLGVDCIVERVDVPDMAKAQGLSIETAARQARYTFLDAQDVDFIATAHHMDDNAETVLMNLVRGSGMAGLCGIPEKRGKYIRPMLDISRSEIERYAAENEITYVCDSTNDDASYTRNYIRKEVLPRLGRINEGAGANIARAAKLLREDDEALNAAAKNAGCISEDDDGVYINIEKMLAQSTAVQRRIVRLAVAQLAGLKDIEHVHVGSVLALVQRRQNAKRIDLPGDLFAAVVYGKLMIGKNKPKRYNKPLVTLQEAGRFAFGNMAFESEPFEGEPVYGDGVEYFDAQAIAGAVLRHRKESDFIRPLGMNGRKRLSDYLADRKVPLMKRDDLVLLAKGSEVFWAVGVGMSETAKVRKGKKAIKIRVWER